LKRQKLISETVDIVHASMNGWLRHFIQEYVLNPNAEKSIIPPFDKKWFTLA
jgi:hypothetical protein